MTSRLGPRVGHYNIIAPLGAGGMGEVYRASDTRLGREVALKVLPEAFATDADRLARFEREARVLASLNHSNIAAIYGFEPLGQTGALVMELVEGPTLEEKLARGPLGLKESFAIARQIAEALEYAHERGIVHRDLKPANVKVRDDGTLKVLDFGLAKAIEGDGSGTSADLADSPTLTMRATLAGAILGTAAYMSPEQAGGRPADRRADIWSFGVILFEMFSGERLFEGETATETLASVMKDPIPWERLPASVPPGARNLLERCLTRDPRRRLQAIGEARIALEEWTVHSVPAVAMPSGPAPRALRLPWVSVAGWVLAGALAVSLPLLLRGGLGGKSEAPTYLSVMMPLGDRIAGGTESGLIAISPDGRTIAVCVRRAGSTQLYLRRLGATGLTPIEGTTDARNPFFSPDGEWIGYFANAALYKVSVRGGKPTELCPAGTDRGGVWLEDGNIVLAPGFSTALMQVSADGGAARSVTVLDSTRHERTHRWPERLPGSEWLLFTCGTADSPGDYEEASIEAVSRRTGERRRLVRGAMARYSPSGHLIFARGGILHAGPLNPRNPQPLRNPVPVVRGVGGETTSGAYHFALAEDGTLVYIPSGVDSEDSEIVWLDQQGVAKSIGAPLRRYRYLSLSPDRTRILASAGRGGGNPMNLFLIDVETGASSRLPVEYSAELVQWLPDGDHFVVSGGAGGIVLGVGATGSSRLLRVLTQSVLPLALMGCTPDGREAIFGEYGTADADILSVPVIGDSTNVRTVVSGSGNQSYGRVSPDGRWISFQSNDTGRGEIFVQSYRGPGQRVQITSNGGQWSTWSPDGRTLCFVESGIMMAAAVQSRGEIFAVGAPRRLFDVPYSGSLEMPLRSFDMDAGGTRFLTSQPRGAVAERREIVVGRRWTAALRAELKGAK